MVTREKTYITPVKQAPLVFATERASYKNELLPRFLLTATLPVPAGTCKPVAVVSSLIMI